MFSLLLHQLDPQVCDFFDVSMDSYFRAKSVIDSANAMNVITYVEPADLLSKSSSINKLFLTNVYEDITTQDAITVLRGVNYRLLKTGISKTIRNLGADLMVSA